MNDRVNESRRRALARLGLASAAFYTAPSILRIDRALASPCTPPGHGSTPPGQGGSPPGHGGGACPPNGHDDDYEHGAGDYDDDYGDDHDDDD